MLELVDKIQNYLSSYPPDLYTNEASKMQLTKLAMMVVALGFNTQNLIHAEQKKLILSLNGILD